MIRVHGNQFQVGSLPPRFIEKVGDFRLPTSTMEAIQGYLDLSAWDKGMNFLILGGPLTGKTSTGLYLMRSIHKKDHDLNMVYWTEADFHADLRNLWRYESLVQSSPKDAPLWDEYLAWERDLWDLKEAPLLFMDEFGRGHTPNHKYEVETMLRRRRDMGFGTIVAADLAAWQSVPGTVKSLFNDGVEVTLQGAVNAER